MNDETGDDVSEQNAKSGNHRQEPAGLTPRQTAYVVQRLMGMSQKASAEKIGIAIRTAGTWDNLPAVRDALRVGQDELIGEATGTATALLRPALVKLMEIANNADAPASARVTALRAVADLALKLREHNDLAERVSRLEALNAQS